MRARLWMALHRFAMHRTAPACAGMTGGDFAPTAMIAGTLLLTLLSACSEGPPETPPRQLAGSPFHYPEQLWDAGVEGETLLRLFVNEAGRVDTALVERTSGHPEFDSAAVAGAPDLRFEPALKEEEPVGVWVLLPVQFELPDSANP